MQSMPQKCDRLQELRLYTLFFKKLRAEINFNYSKEPTALNKYY